MIGRYDYYSIMHYFNTGFTKDGSITFTVKDKSVDPNVIGRGDGLSSGDLEAIEILYPKGNDNGDGSDNGKTCETAKTYV